MKRSVNNFLPSDHTFVICAYKDSPYLETCIRSLLAQSVKSSVLISTSTPGKFISNLADKYDIPVFINDGTKGIAGDWNFALSCADTALITLAHQDDVYESDYVKTMLHRVNLSQNPILFFSNYYELRNNEKIEKNKLTKIKRILSFPCCAFPKSKFLRRCGLAFGNFICCPSVTYVGEIIKKYPFQTGLKSNLDWLKWEELSKLSGSFVSTNEYLMCHRIHPDSETSHIISSNARSEEDYLVFLHFWPAPVAKFITRLYSLGEKSNEV